MKGKRIEKLDRALYGALSPAERMHLLVEICARGEQDEAKRLQDATPNFTYRCPDVRFSERCRATFSLLREIRSAIQRAKCQIEIFKQLSLELPIALVEAVAIHEGSPPAWVPWAAYKTMPEREVLARNHTNWQASYEPLALCVHRTVYMPILFGMKWRWLAFDRVCQERLGVEGELLLKAFATPDELEFILWLKGELRELEMDDNDSVDEQSIENNKRHYEEIFTLIQEENHE